jgi:CBS domain-containing protein
MTVSTPIPAGRSERDLPASFSRLCAADVMQRDLVTAQIDDPLSTLERIFADERVSGVPVLDGDERLVGILSMADLVRRYAENQDLPDDDAYPRFGDDLDDTELVAFAREQQDEPCAGDLMSTDVATVAPDTPLRSVARVLVERRIHRVLVVDRSRVVGLCSTLDLLRAVAD